MIAEQDRSGYFGASDTSFIMGNTQTKTFKKWWLEKMGISSKKITTVAMSAGTHFEHKILESIDILSHDKQIIIEPLKLRVNLDGDKDKCIYEVKTYKANKNFVMPKKYIQQMQVQLFATGWEDAVIISYGLTDKDYKNFFNEIDPERRKVHIIQRDDDFIYKQYVPRLAYFAECLRKGVFPNDPM